MDPDRREAMIEEHADERDYPESDRLAVAVEDGLSFWRLRHGDPGSVTVSPDVGQHGERGQRARSREALLILYEGSCSGSTCRSSGRGTTSTRLRFERAQTRVPT
jgi:hypothetical protein